MQTRCVDQVKVNVVLAMNVQASAEMDGSYPPLPPTPSGRAILIGIAVGILMWLLASLAVASICKAVQYIYSEEEEPSAVKSIFVSLPHALFRLLVTSIWVLLLSVATVITISLPFYLLSLLFKDKHAALLGMLNQLFISVAITILGFLFLLSQEVAVLEPHNYGLAALKRSSKLVQKKFLAALTLFALSILVGGLISKLSTTVAGLPDTGKVPHWTVYVCAALLAILYLAYMVYILLVTVVLYFSSKVNYDAEEGTLPEFRHSSHENPYTPLVVVSHSLLPNPHNNRVNQELTRQNSGYTIRNL